MFSFRTTPIEQQDDLVLSHGKLGLLCNQSAWHADTGEYLFDILKKRGNLKRIFMPEHGLFAEQQDQVKIADGKGDLYSRFADDGTDIVSLYGNTEDSLTADISKLTDLDALIVELQDVGCRYYTYPSTLNNIFKVLKDNDINLHVYIIDHANPAGRQVEGTMLRAGYRSFIGLEGIVHRHGLTFGELAYYLYNEMNAKFPLHIISYKAYPYILLPWSIPPSPNFPGLFTPMLYSGQCLWEGTNVSEGRGTTRPFELFGAPFMKPLVSKGREYGGWNQKESPLYDKGALVRYMAFIPTFHKYKDECCYCFQILLKPDMQYNALAHNLRIMRFVHDNCKEFTFRPGRYEAGNDKTAIELLLGDKDLLDYVKGGNGGNADEQWQEIKEHIKVEEQKWIKKVRRFTLYDEPLFRVK